MRVKIIPTLVIAALAVASPTLAEDDTVRDYTPEGTVKQPSFVSDAGTINKNEHAFVFYANGDVLPPALMAGYRYGLYYWWEVGVDVGGDYGVFQALLHNKMENFKTIKTELFYWGSRFNTGFKYHKAEFSDDTVFDDLSWIYELTNTFAFRFGEGRKQAIYLNTSFYIDQDLHDPKRQTDLYFRPAVLGFETIVGKHGNFFVEAGFIWSINGMETEQGILYEGDLFPVARIGFAVRTDDKTAIYYTKETKDKAKL